MKTLVSIIIPVSNDKKIKSCLESIDEDAEIIVVLNNNPTKEVIDIVAQNGRCKSIFIHDHGCNLAKVFNEGINAASNSKILLMNSDCVFDQGLIKEVYQSLDEYDVVKARVVFSHTNLRERLVSECRFIFHHVFEDGKKLFGPGLAFKKSIVGHIGEYFFDENMGWGEDGDLSKRINSSSLKILFLKKNVRHCEENMAHDLRITYRIGKGNGIRDRIGNCPISEALVIDLEHFITDHHNQFRTAYQHGGWSLLAYFFMWKLAFHAGYYKAMLTKEES